MVEIVYERPKIINFSKTAYTRLPSLWSAVNKGESNSET